MELKNTPKPWYESYFLLWVISVILFPVGLYGIWKNNSLKKERKIGFSILIAIWAIFYIGQLIKKDPEDAVVLEKRAERKKKEIRDSLKALQNSDEQDRKISSNLENSSSNKALWVYTEDRDEMDNSLVKMALVGSTNEVEFPFPYGTCSFFLGVRKNKSGTDVFIKCTSCQFLYGVMDDKLYRVKFDDEKPFKVLARPSSSGGADVVFLGSQQKLLSKFKTSKKLLIEPEFYESGFRMVEFNLEGFEWK